MNSSARWILFSLGIAAFVGALYLTAKALTPPRHTPVIEGYQPWSPETLEIAATIPVQDGGRVKPLSSYAAFTLKRLSGARSMKIQTEEGSEAIRLEPLAWLLDSYFRPQLALREPSFLVEDSDVLRAIGVTPKEKRRDRYSYDDLSEGIGRLYELAQTYTQSEPAARTPLENQVIALASNIRDYEQLLGTFALARNGVTMMSLESGVEGRTRTVVSNLMAPEAVGALREVMQRSQMEGGAIPPHVRDLLDQILQGVNASKFGVFVFPPSNPEDSDWVSPGDRVMNVLTQTTRDVEGSIQDIQSIERVATSILPAAGKAEDFAVREERFREALADFRTGIVERAKARGEYASVPLEVKYYASGWFHWSLGFFMIGVVLAIAMWMVQGSAEPAGRAGAASATGLPPSRLLGWGVAATTAAGWVFVVIAIAMRCIIMERPPVGNLYDTIIFIAGSFILFGAIVEVLTKRRIALGMLPIGGAILILLSMLFEVGDAKDHMDPLVAVLRSSFWLTTHVICITLGYAAGLVTAMLSIIYVLRRGLGLDRGDRGSRRSLTRAVYGMVCLSLFLALVGTVLGGIWANDSWGRFWGWDPKENGALMIVLLYLAILHARLGGFLKEWGLHLASIFGAAVVTFSWWGVNMLNTGLHSYGFAEGASAINGVYALVGLLIGFGLVARALEQARLRAVEASPAAAGERKSPIGKGEPAEG